MVEKRNGRLAAERAGLGDGAAEGIVGEAQCIVGEVKILGYVAVAVVSRVVGAWPGLSGVPADCQQASDSARPLQGAAEVKPPGEDVGRHGSISGLLADAPSPGIVGEVDNGVVRTGDIHDAVFRIPDEDAAFFFLRWSGVHRVRLAFSGGCASKFCWVRWWRFLGQS